MGYEVVANIYPAKDKVDVVREGLQGLADKVKADEKGCLRYQVYEQQNAADGEAPQFVVVEEYEDRAAYEAHLSSSAFKELAEQARAESLLAKPLDIKYVTKVGGFFSR